MYSRSVQNSAPAARGGEVAHFTRLARTAQLVAALFGLLFYASAVPAGAVGAHPTAAVTNHTILVVGDSLSAGFGIDVERGWVQLLQERLAAQGHARWKVVNASISGDTTAGGLTRLPPLLAENKPAIVILELGGNDGLRALPVASMRTNLREMVEQSKAAGARVVLVGMRMPPNYGPLYTRTFAAVYGDLARSLRVPLVPFLLDGVAGHPDLMQPDGIHANEAGQPKMLDNVWPQIKPLLATASERR